MVRSHREHGTRTMTTWEASSLSITVRVERREEKKKREKYNEPTNGERKKREADNNNVPTTPPNPHTHKKREKEYVARTT